MDSAKDVGADSELELESGSLSDAGAVESLLVQTAYPPRTLVNILGRLFLGKVNGALVAVVGVEMYGESALLRSLCVSAPRRGRGTGRAMLSAIEAIMATQGVRDAYLLTTTAERFFEREGFAAISRDQAPLAIAQTLEFRTLCPSSATVMHKRLG